MIDRLRSNIRGKIGVPYRMILAANPGDVGHQWLYQRYYAPATAWKPFRPPESNRPIVYCHSTYLDNPFIDHKLYREQLETSGRHDPELARAWISGDWTINRGAFFANVLEESRVAVSDWPRPKSAKQWGRKVRRWEGWSDKDWDWFLAYDHGTASPAALYVSALSPGSQGPDGRWYPRGSIILVDELASYESQDNLNTGLRWTIRQTAEEALDLCEDWIIPARGFADDEIFASRGESAGSIAAEFQASGVHFLRARKGRRKHGWEVMRQLLADAGSERPGLYVCSRCSYWWATIPFLSRDPRRPDDLAPGQPDHGADATRYACISMGRRQKLRVQEFLL